MDRSILEYATTDKFIHLFLTSSRVGEIDHICNERVITVFKDTYDDNVVEMYQDDDLGIPDIITCTEFSFNLDDDVELHGVSTMTDKTKRHSFSTKKLSLRWVKNKDILHRENGPAEIDFENFKTHHWHGYRRGFSFDNCEFRWYENGILKRDSGPHTVWGDKVNAIIDNTTNTMRTTSPFHISCSWIHPGDGKNIIEADINKAIEQSKLKINRINPFTSVFDSTFDEMVFYSTV